MPDLIIISCGKTKAATPQPAADLYTGAYFKTLLRYARHHAPGHNILIISAQHGLLPLHRIVAPYNQRLGWPGCITPSRVHEQAARLKLLDRRDVWVLGGRPYVHIVRTVWPHAVSVLEGRGRLCEQREWLKAQLMETAHA